MIESMLGRYRIYRGKRPADDALPEGVRQDTRKHTRHVLRPAAAAVTRYLAGEGTAADWRRFEREYLGLLERRFSEDRRAFDELARLAREGDLYLGCNCPTRKNPDVRRCHTVPALRFMKAKYSDLAVVFPAS